MFYILSLKYVVIFESLVLITYNYWKSDEGKNISNTISVWCGDGDLGMYWVKSNNM